MAAASFFGTSAQAMTASALPTLTKYNWTWLSLCKRSDIGEATIAEDMPVAVITDRIGGMDTADTMVAAIRPMGMAMAAIRPMGMAMVAIQPMDMAMVAAIRTHMVGQS